MTEPRTPYSFPCTDDAPTNNGYGHKDYDQEEREEVEEKDMEDELDEEDLSVVVDNLNNGFSVTNTQDGFFIV